MQKKKKNTNYSGLTNQSVESVRFLISGMQAAAAGQAGHMIQQHAMGVASANNMPHAQMHYHMHPHHHSKINVYYPNDA